MAKLTIMKGLPASGKSTRAKAILTEGGRAVRINKDLLRTMLHFDKWTGKNEELTHKCAKALALALLKDNISVVIDDTNLNEKIVRDWKLVGKMADAKIVYGDMTDVDINECIARDAVREKKVGKDVIINMALRTGLYKIPGPILICDLDGTLCNIDHRLHYTQVKEGEKKNWKAFFDEIPNDTPNKDVQDLLEVNHELGAHIVFVSGRPETCKKATLDWLNKHGIAYFTTLLMRRADDKRPDDEVKRDLLHAHIPNKEDIVLVIDDRPRVIRMWREEGLEVIDVGDGVEF